MKPPLDDFITNEAKAGQFFTGGWIKVKLILKSADFVNGSFFGFAFLVLRWTTSHINSKTLEIDLVWI